MTEEKPENPAAFPFVCGPESSFEAGMSLRDWFAGQYATGVAAMRIGDASAAREAYAFADAMLAERVRK